MDFHNIEDMLIHFLLIPYLTILSKGHNASSYLFQINQSNNMSNPTLSTK